jgi:hypothetical protein
MRVVYPEWQGGACPERTAVQNHTATPDRQAEEVHRLRRLLDQLPGYFWLAGVDGSMEYVSDDLRRFLGVNMETIAVSGWTANVHPDECEGAT